MVVEFGRTGWSVMVVEFGRTVWSAMVVEFGRTVWSDISLFAHLHVFVQFTSVRSSIVTCAVTSGTSLTRLTSVHECQKQYCDLRCDLGYKLDSHGCETCQCKDACDGVTCRNSEVCIKGTCGELSS